MKEAIVTRNGADITTDEIIKAYFSFCKERKFSTRSIREVESELKDLMPEIHNSHYANHVRGEKSGPRDYRNVAFKQEPDASATEDNATDDPPAGGYRDEDLPF